MTRDSADDLEFFLTYPFSGRRPDNRIEHAEFKGLQSSFLYLKDDMQLEESMLQIIYSLEEYEEFILKSSLHHHFFPLSEYEFFQDSRVRSNIKVLSFLNSVTSFRDQFPKFKSQPSLSQIREDFLSLWDKKKAISVTFHFFERLRNYAQHQTQPVSSATIGAGWDEKREMSEARASVFVKVNDACTNRKIPQEEKQRYIAEFGEMADISLIFRETSGCIGDILKDIRGRTQIVFDKSAEEYEKFLQITRDGHGNYSPCDVVSITKGQRTKEFSMFPDFLQRAKRLRRIFLMTNNERHFVSNRAFGHSSSKRK